MTDVIRQYIESLANGDIEHCIHAPRELGKLGAAAVSAVPILIATLKRQRTYWEIRGDAAWALGEISPGVGAKELSALIEALTEALDDTGALAHVADHAASALGKIGPRAVAAIPALIQALKGPARYNAAFALGEIGPQAAVAGPALYKLISDSNSAVREIADKVLRRLAGEAC